MEQVLREHERIWAALEEGDQKKAKEAVLLHLGTTEKILLAVMEADEGETQRNLVDVFIAKNLNVYVVPAWCGVII